MLRVIITTYKVICLNINNWLVFADKA